MSLRVLFLEPFLGGSHAAFADTLAAGLPFDWTRRSLPARHWKWRLRGSAAWFAEQLAEEHPELQDTAPSAPAFDLLLATSFVPLAELVGLLPGLAAIPRVLYFHENQWAYPNRAEHSGERDLHFAITQTVAARAATRVWFNSGFNRQSFLDGARDWLRRMPDARPRRWLDDVEAHSEVLPVPLDVPATVPERTAEGRDPAAGPVLLWNHRFEHDKDPETFFRALEALRQEGTPFRLIVCGKEARAAPAVFAAARPRLGEHLLHWGEASPERYRGLLRQADLVVSTALQEFQGLSVLEAVAHGACPVAPDRLSYQEYLPAECRYSGEEGLVAMLRRRCREWSEGRSHRDLAEGIVAPLRKEVLLPRYRERCERLAGRP